MIRDYDRRQRLISAVTVAAIQVGFADPVVVVTSWEAATAEVRVADVAGRAVIMSLDGLRYLGEVSDLELSSWLAGALRIDRPFVGISLGGLCEELSQRKEAGES